MSCPASGPCMFDGLQHKQFPAHLSSFPTTRLFPAPSFSIFAPLPRTQPPLHQVVGPVAWVHPAISRLWKPPEGHHCMQHESANSDHNRCQPDRSEQAIDGTLLADIRPEEHHGEGDGESRHHEHHW